MMQSALRDLLVSTPPWVMAGAAVDFDFQNSRYYQLGSGGGPSNLITCSRASIGYADDQAGNWSSFASGAPRITNKGLLVEESRTNSIRNNSMQGANPAYPTNWVNRNTINIPPTVVASGTENGIDYIDLQWNGTTNGGNGGFFQLQMEPNGVVAAALNQTWTAGFFVKFIAGSFTNVTGIISSIASLDNVGTQLGVYSSNAVVPTTAGLGTQRISLTQTLPDAGTAFIAPILRLQTPSGVSSAVNLTLRVGLPQLELGAFATSPIRTTSAAATRAADVVTLTKVPNLTGGAISVASRGTPLAPSSYAVDQVIAHIDDGTSANRIYLSRGGSSNNAQLVYTVASSSTVVTSSGWGQSVDGRYAVAVQAADQAQTLNAGTIGTGAGAGFPAGLANIRFGSNQSGSAQFNGYIKRSSVISSARLSNADLQRITT